MGICRELSDKRMMVVAGHERGVEAGLRMLDQGGSATDALIASAAVLCVVLPQAVTLGGDAFGLFYDAETRSTHALNASGRSPANKRVGELSPPALERGPCASTVPALVRGWELAHARFGRLPWEKLFVPAIEAAETGVAVSRVLAGALQARRDLIEADRDLAALFIPHGRPLVQHDLLRQPQLAATLRNIARGGASDFYQGAIAASLVKRLNQDGGLLSGLDFAACAAEWTKPIAVNYRDYTAVTSPPNSFGLLALLQLQQLATVSTDLASLPDGERIRLLIGSSEFAIEQAQRYLADPAAIDGDLHVLLNGPPSAPIASSGEAPHPAGTAVTMVVDGDGNGAVLVESIFTLFGSGVYDAATGILLNNRMSAFSHDASSPNFIAPGKRPAHTLSPLLLLDGDKLNMLFATPGGLGQTATLVQAITNHVDRELPMPQAISAPRWSYDLDRRVILEPDLPYEVDNALRAASITFARPPADTPYFGSVKTITVGADRTVSGFADRRRDGCVGGR